jgi:hypothetical protein
MVLEAAILGGGASGGEVVGSDEGGALAISGAEGGGREAARACTCEAVVAASAIHPGVEDDSTGPACQ